MLKFAKNAAGEYVAVVPLPLIDQPTIAMIRDLGVSTPGASEGVRVEGRVYLPAEADGDHYLLAALRFGAEVTVAASGLSSGWGRAAHVVDGTLDGWARTHCFYEQALTYAEAVEAAIERLKSDLSALTAALLRREACLQTCGTLDSAMAARAEPAGERGGVRREREVVGGRKVSEGIGRWRRAERSHGRIGGGRGMSQIVEVKPEQVIKDIPALTAAAKDLGLELQGRGEVRFYSGTRTADYVLRLPGKYDLGFVKKADGSYSYLADNELIGGRSGSDGYGRSGEGRKVLGENCGKLLQRYRYRFMERELKARRYRVTERGVSAKGELVFEYEREGYGRA